MIQEYAPFSDMIIELTRICTERKTGVMYITSQKNRSAQLMLDKGKIVFIYYCNKRGRDALQLMPEIGASRFRFQEGTTPTMKANLPTTDEILSYLSGASGLNDSVGSAQKSASLAEQERHGIVNALTADQKQILEESLAIYIGPMAALICEDHLVSDIDVTVAINLLAGEIPTATQAKIFKEEMLNRLIK